MPAQTENKKRKASAIADDFVLSPATEAVAAAALAGEPQPWKAASFERAEAGLEAFERELAGKPAGAPAAAEHTTAPAAATAAAAPAAASSGSAAELAAARPGGSPAR